MNLNLTHNTLFTLKHTTKDVQQSGTHLPTILNIGNIRLNVNDKNIEKNNSIVITVVVILIL